MAFVALHKLHEVIWPGEGIFLNTFEGTARRFNDPHPPGDFSGVGSFRFWVVYYISAGLGILISLYGTWLRNAETMHRHLLYTEMKNEDEENNED